MGGKEKNSGLGGVKFEGQSTMEVPDKLRFDIPVLQTYMQKHIPGFSGELTVRKFGLGQSNPTFLLTASSGSKYVMRKQPPGKLIKGAHAVDREARVIKALGQSGFPVPKVFGLCTDKDVLGSMFYIMSFKKGEIVDNAMLTAPASRRSSMLFNIAKTLGHLHTLDIDELGLSDYGKQGGFYTRQIKTLSKVTALQLERGGGKVSAIPTLTELLAWFRSNMPVDKCTLVHGDYKPDNVVFTRGSSKVIAVLDWELSTLGHPLSDLANTCLPYYFPDKNGIYPSFRKGRGLVEGIPSEEALHQVYCEATNTPYPIPKWHFFIAFALFRLAVILQGVAMRASRGQASSANAFRPQMSFAVLKLFSQMWWKVIKEAEQPAKL